MASTPSLRSDLASWDGKNADAIRAVYARQAGKRGFVGSLVRLAAEADLEVASSWLIKHHLEQEASDCVLSEAQAEAFFRAAARFDHWEARLHALQIMEFVEIPTGSVRDAKRLIERCLADENKFVRAWAYSGFARLAQSHPRYRAEAEALLADAEANESAASVRADQTRPELIVLVTASSRRASAGVRTGLIAPRPVAHARGSLVRVSGDARDFRYTFAAANSSASRRSGRCFHAPR